MSKFENYISQAFKEAPSWDEYIPLRLDLTAHRLDRLVEFVDYLKTINAIDFCITWFQTEYDTASAQRDDRTWTYMDKSHNWATTYVPSCGTSACIAGHLGLWSQFINDGGSSHRGLPRISVDVPTARKYNFAVNSCDEQTLALQMEGIAAFAEYFGMDDDTSALICWGDDASEHLYGVSDSDLVTLQDAIAILEEVIDRNNSGEVIVE